MVLCQKSNMIFFAFLITKNIAVFAPQSTIPVKLICFIGFGSASSAC